MPQKILILFLLNEELKEISKNSQKVGKEGKKVTIYAIFINQSFLPASSIAVLALHLAFSLLIRKVK